MSQETIIFIVIGLVAAFFAAFFITPIIRKIAIRVGAVDIPKDERRMHSKPIPTIGGLAIFISFALCSLILLTIYGGMDEKYTALLTGALLIVVLGVLDDRYGLRWWIKFLGQFAAAFLVVLNGITIDNIASYDLGYWSVPVTVLWIVAITNAINLIDGLDGLACGIVGISCVSLLIVATFSVHPANQAVTIVIAILAGACFGFLPYNVHPAKIFMGDTGSMFIGYTLAVISIQGFFKINALLSFGTPFLVLALPILDTVFAFFRRIFSGRNPFKPDKKHMHHQLINLGLSQRETVGLMYSISGVLGLSAILLSRSSRINATIAAGEITSEAVINAPTEQASREAAARAIESAVNTRNTLLISAIIIMVAAFAVGLIYVNYKRMKSNVDSNCADNKVRMYDSDKECK